MGVDVDKKVQTTYTVIDNATSATMRLAQLMSGLGKSTSNARRMLRSFGNAQTQMGQRVSAATKRISSSTTQLNRSATAMKRAALAANVAKKATRQSTVTQRQAITATRNLSSSTSSLRGTFILAAAAAATFFAVMQVRDIVRISKSFEDTQLAIAGTVQALGFTKDFPTTLNTTAAAMEKIRVQAALLPGEVQDYVQVFRLGLAGMRGAVGGTLNDMIEFSGKFTAITRTMQIDSQQASRDLSLMLSAIGRAGTEVKSFVNLLTVMREIPGHASLTAKTFNVMTQQARGNLLAKAFEKYDDAIAHAQTTLDAQAGAFKSNLDLAKRLGGAALFKGLKDSLTFMNEALMTSDGQMTNLMKTIVGVGEAISKGIVAGMEAAGAAAKTLYNWTNKAIGAMANIGGGLASEVTAAGAAAGGAMANIGSGLASAAGAAGAAAGGAMANIGGGGLASAAGVAAGGGAMLLGVSGPVGLVIAGLIDFASRAEAVAAVMSEVSRFGEMLLVPFGALTNAAMLVSALIGDVFEGALAGTISMLTDVFGPVLGLLAGVVNIVVELFVALRPTLMNLWKAVGVLFTGIGKFLNPIIRIIGVAFLGIFKIVSFILTPILKVLGTIIWSVIGVFGLLIKAIGGWIGIVADAVENVTGLSTGFGGGAPDKKNENRDFIAELFAQFKYKAPKTDESLLEATAAAPGGRGGGGRTVQDFRYSRFQIDQKFAEGFDPDRIAVMFANDLGKIGEQKLQSGFEPLFGLK